MNTELTKVLRDIKSCIVQILASPHESAGNTHLQEALEDVQSLQFAWSVPHAMHLEHCLRCAADLGALSHEKCDQLLRQFGAAMRAEPGPEPEGSHVLLRKMNRVAAAIQAAINANQNNPNIGRLEDALEDVRILCDEGENPYRFMHAEYALKRAGRDDLVTLLRETRLEPESEPEFVALKPEDIGIKPLVAKVLRVQDMCLFIRADTSRHDIIAAVKRWRHIRRATEIAAGERLVGPAPGDTVPDGSEAAEMGRLIDEVYCTRVGGWFRSSESVRREERTRAYVIKHLGIECWNEIDDSAKQGG